MADLLSALGCPCGHEKIFNIWRIFGIGKLADPMNAFFDPEAHAGDASFLSVPYLEQLPEGTVVLHQVRNPLDVIRSHMGIQFFSEQITPTIYLAEHHSEILSFLRTNCPIIFDAELDIARCVRYWYYWNKMAENASSIDGIVYFRYRIEEIDHASIAKIAEYISADVAISDFEHLRDAAPRVRNARQRDTSWNFANLPEANEKEKLFELATKYGYTL